MGSLKAHQGPAPMGGAGPPRRGLIDRAAASHSSKPDAIRCQFSGLRRPEKFVTFSTSSPPSTLQISFSRFVFVSRWGALNKKRKKKLQKLWKISHFSSLLCFAFLPTLLRRWAVEALCWCSLNHLWLCEKQDFFIFKSVCREALARRDVHFVAVSLEFLKKVYFYVVWIWSKVIWGADSWLWIVTSKRTLSLSRGLSKSCAVWRRRKVFSQRTCDFIRKQKTTETASYIWQSRWSIASLVWWTISNCFFEAENKVNWHKIWHTSTIASRRLEKNISKRSSMLFALILNFPCRA